MGAETAVLRVVGASEWGLHAIDGEDNTFLRMYVGAVRIGIADSFSRRTRIEDCEVFAEQAVTLASAEAAMMRRNGLHASLQGLEVASLSLAPATLAHFAHDIDGTNLVNGRPVLYRVGGAGEDLDCPWPQFIRANRWLISRRGAPDAETPPPEHGPRTSSRAR